MASKPTMVSTRKRPETARKEHGSNNMSAFTPLMPAPHGSCRRALKSRSLVASLLRMTLGLLLTNAAVSILEAQRVPTTRDELAVLSLPDPKLDDTIAYQGYSTRFYRDSKGNVVQIYLRRNEGRVVNLWADAANESLGLTIRDSSGAPAPINWGTEIALTSDSGSMRVVSYRLTSSARALRLGWFVLGTMRIERDFQYWRKHLDPFTAPAFHVAEEDSLVSRL